MKVAFFKLGFSPCKAEQPLQGMELQEKEAQKDESIQGISLAGLFCDFFKKATATQIFFSRKFTKF